MEIDEEGVGWKVHNSVDGRSFSPSLSLCPPSLSLSLSLSVSSAAKETTVVIQQQMTQELDEAKQSVKRQEEQSTQLEQEMKDRIQIMEVEMEK